MYVERIATDDALQQLSGDWNCLAHGVPFRGWEWLSCWWKHYGGDFELFVLAVRDADGLLVGVAPWFLDPSSKHRRVIQFLGSGDVCSDYLTLLTTVEHEDAVVQSIGDWLANAASSNDADQWDLLKLDGVISNDRVMAKFVGTLAEHGCVIHRRQGLSCWSASLPASWEAFLASRSTKSRRRKLKRWKRALDDGTFDIRTADSQTLPTAMESFIDLHQRRRHSLGEPGCFSSDKFRGFMTDVASELVDTGQLGLTWLEHEGTPLAADFNLLGNKTMYAYQSGVDPDSLHLSPGHVLTTGILANLIERGFTTYDLLRGDEGYKSDWGANPRATTCFRIVPNRFGPRVRQRAWITGRALKDWIKGGLSLAGMV